MSKLYLVPTPIGNMQDITLRALDILRSVELIYSEDTRRTGILLKHFDIRTRMQAYHKDNEHRIVNQIVMTIASGQISALVTDAGTPAVSDPGFLLVRECVKGGVPVETLPGATAFVPALVNSGLPNDRFVFEGFLPQKKGRQKQLKALENETRTMIFYESPHRLLKALEQMSEIFGNDRQASVSRELTKIYEETQRGTLAELHKYFSQKEIKGEIVLVVSGFNMRI